jgi:hypothetical protein
MSNQEKKICLNCGGFYFTEEVINSVCCWCHLENRFSGQEQDSTLEGPSEPSKGSNDSGDPEVLGED